MGDCVGGTVGTAVVGSFVGLPGDTVGAVVGLFVGLPGGEVGGGEGAGVGSCVGGPGLTTMHTLHFFLHLVLYFLIEQNSAGPSLHDVLIPLITKLFG